MKIAEACWCNTNNNNNILISPPIFSVIVCTYNRATLLLRALRSAIFQTFNQKYEIILVDDGSEEEENIFAVALQIDKEAPSNVTLTFKKNDINQGVAAAKNKGLSVASGRYICFLDSDDMYTCDYLKNVYIQVTTEKNSQGDVFDSRVSVVGSREIVDQDDEGKGMVDVDMCKLGGTFILTKKFLSRFTNKICFKPYDYAHDYKFYKSVISDPLVNWVSIRYQLGYIYDRVSTSDQITKRKALKNHN